MSRNINTGMLSVTIVLLSSDTEKLTYEYDSTSLSESMIIDRIITTWHNEKRTIYTFTRQ